MFFSFPLFFSFFLGGGLASSVSMRPRVSSGQAWEGVGDPDGPGSLCAAPPVLTGLSAGASRPPPPAHASGSPGVLIPRYGCSPGNSALWVLELPTHAASDGALRVLADVFPGLEEGATLARHA